MAAPETVLEITAGISSQSTLFTLTDITPVGVGTTGYNQTLGLQIADVTEATLTVAWYFPDTTVQNFLIALVPSTYNPLPFIAGEVYSLQMDSFGGNIGDKFPDVVWNIIYTVNGTAEDDPVSYSVECWKLLPSQACCCIDEKKALLPDVDVAELSKQDLNLKGAVHAASCGKTKKALYLLNEVQKYCNNDCKNC